MSPLLQPPIRSCRRLSLPPLLLQPLPPLTPLPHEPLPCPLRSAACLRSRLLRSWLLGWARLPVAAGRPWCGSSSASEPLDPELLSLPPLSPLLHVPAVVSPALSPAVAAPVLPPVLPLVLSPPISLPLPARALARPQPRTARVLHVEAQALRACWRMRYCDI